MNVQSVATGFSLRDHVRQAIAQRPGTAPGLVAGAIAEELPDDVLRTALSQSLPNFVRVLMTNDQRPTLRQWDALCEGVATTEPATGDAPIVPAVAMTVYATGEWKPLADCDVPDLEDMAARRQRMAVGNAAWAQRFKALADGTTVQAAAGPETLLRDGLASIPVLQVERERLSAYARRGSSPRLDELRRRREALQQLRLVRREEAEWFARLEALIDEREAQHGEG